MAASINKFERPTLAELDKVLELNPGKALAADKALIVNEDRSFSYQRFHIEQTGIQLPEDTSQDEWLSLGTVIRDIESAVQWVIGDWASFANHKWDVDYETMAREFGYQIETLYTYAGVARAIPPSIRNRGLSFSHHRLVIKLPPDQQVEWLAAAAKNGWTLSQMRATMNPNPPALPDNITRFRGKLTRLKQEFSAVGEGERMQLVILLRQAADEIERGE